MRRLIRVIILLSVIGSVEAAGTQAWVRPDSARVNQYGDWKVFLRLEEAGLPAGGQIKIQFPNCWHTSPWPEGKLKKEQSIDPAVDNYLHVDFSRPDCRGSVTVVREGIDGQQDRFGRAFVISLKEGELLPGDTIVFSFCNTSAPTIAESQKIGIALDPAGSGKFIPIAEYPVIDVQSASPAILKVIAPSQAVVGRETEIHVVALDHWYNAAGDYRAHIEISSTDTALIAPQNIRFRRKDRGVLKIPVRFQSEGIHSIRVRGNQNIAPHCIESNPVRVNRMPGKSAVFWGDLHSHCNQSKDGYGKAETAFHYARDVAALDFYALTDHGAGDPLNDSLWSVGLTPEEWTINQELVDQYYQEGDFVTLLACEWSGWSPYGHHNIYYRTNQGRPFAEDQIPKVEDVWKQLTTEESFTVPHHTGLAWWNGVGHNTDWRRPVRDDIRIAIEIYSLWGCSEFYGNEMPYENYHQRNLISNPQPNYARNAWENGHYVGVVGGSDDHNSKPGKDFGGLTAVLCSRLDRKSVFDALRNRHSYATTGQRILLDFRINDEIMGSRCTVSPDSSLSIQVEAVGTHTIDWLEVVAYDGFGWSVPYRITPADRKISATFRRSPSSRDCLFYVRLKQKNIVGNRRVMAWSSPIWVARSEQPWWARPR